MHYRKLNLFATLAVAATLSLGGCKAKQQTAQNAQPAQPAAQQPMADQPQAAQSAATSASQPAQAGQAAAPTAQPAAQAPASAPAAAAPAPPPQPVEITLPPGTSISVHTDSELGSKISTPNQSFSATIADNVRHDGQIIIPRGARASGVVVVAQAKGKIKGQGELALRLTRVHTKWGSYAISTSTFDSTEKGKGKRTAVASGGGAGLGAIIGGIAGGGKGAAIGALAGGGAGFAGSTFTGNKQIVLPAESLLTFTLAAPVTITEQTSSDDEPGLKQPPAQ